MVLENVSLRPYKIRLSNCISKNNNPRGILISTGGEVVIENNCISSPQAAVRISGDANSWFESGPVEKVIIKNNRFEHCGYSIRNPNKAVIDIDPEIQKIIPDFYYHDTVIVQNNNFSDFTGKLIHGKSFKSLIFTGNKVLHRDWCGKHNLFELEHCKETEIENNKINEACDPALR
jgi:hypothetical protein